MWARSNQVRRQNLPSTDPCSECELNCQNRSLSCEVDDSCRECFWNDDEEACAACAQHCSDCKETGEQEACRKCSINPGIYCQYDQLACLRNCSSDGGPCDCRSTPRQSQRNQPRANQGYFARKALEDPPVPRHAACFNTHERWADIGNCLRPAPNRAPWTDVGPQPCKSRERGRNAPCDAACGGTKDPLRAAQCYLQCIECKSQYR